MPLKRYHQTDLLEAGCDEAGRGCLAGSVFAAAVILNPRMPIEKLNDSKQLSASARDTLRVEIEAKALVWAVASVNPQEIDEINILQASFLAMHRAIEQLTTRPEWLLIDGNRFVPYLGIPHLCVIKGDAKYQSIAAASILAKTHRDEYMQQIGKAHPEYDWQQNKGYPTAAHRSAIQQHGVTPYHRLSFRMQK